MIEIVSTRLAELGDAYARQPTASRRPTLPMTLDGKLNVRAFTVDVCGLQRSQEQHFYRKQELADLVNAAAIAQGLKPIGIRAQDDEDDRAVKQRIAKVGKERDDYARVLAEREGQIERLRRENASLRERLRLVEETGMLVRVPLAP
ncbi:MAG: hypothetical protein INR68_11345 [Methylobacterium mesophilicum]|nr:hypothetical protein [Methylobacterium mesophilicum]